MKRVFLILLALLLPAAALAAKWTPIEAKYDPLHQFRGTCEADSQCFVFVKDSFSDGTGNCYSRLNCECINSTEYLEDDYCENGFWTKRTKLVANTLVEFAQKLQPAVDYTLYCDNASNSIPNLPADFPSSSFNNFCMLKYGNKIGIGTSLNTEFDENILGAAGISGYGECAGDSEWKNCGAGVWFNPEINAAIWLESNPVALDASTTSPIVNLFNIIKSAFTGRPIHSAVSAEIVTKMLATTSSFDKLYLAKAGNSQIFAYFEEKYVEVHGTKKFYTSIAGNYSNLNPEMAFCDSLKNYCDAAGHSCSYLCEPAGATSISGKFRINHIDEWQNELTTNSMSAAWQSLTSKLRLKPS